MDSFIILSVHLTLLTGWFSWSNDPGFEVDAAVQGKCPIDVILCTADLWPQLIFDLCLVVMAVALNDFSWVSLSSIGAEKLSHVPMIQSALHCFVFQSLHLLPPICFHLLQRICIIGQVIRRLKQLLNSKLLGSLFLFEKPC